MQIRAAVLEEFGKPLVVRDVGLDGPKAGEVLVRVVACGVCHTDLYTASGVDPSGYAPTVLGHEGAGVVEAVGAGVTSLTPGDHVLTLFSPQCRECLHCMSGKTNICTAIREQQGLGYLPDGTTRLHRGDERIRHFMGTSTFAEATVMPEIALAKVDPAAPLDVLCTLACGATTGIGAALYIAKVEPGSTVAVFGAGLVGLGAVAGAKLCGAERIAIVDPSAERRAKAVELGATDELAGGEGVVEELVAMTGGFGWDSTFEATGLVAVMRQAVEAARVGWGHCVIAGVAGRGETLDIVPRYLITGRRVSGASFGGARGRDNVPELVGLYLEGKLPLDAFISHHLPLERVNDAFDLMHHQDGIRTVLTFD